jgi:hypothetical protein
MSSEIYEKLKRPFDPKLISWRAGATNAKKNNGVATKCIALAYIDARDVMERLDEVFGLGGWQCRYSHAENKTICEISVLIDGTWITRANGAGDSDIEAEKGAISDAFKRAAVLFGIGRYLYDLPNVWVDCDEWKHIKSPPQLPVWATPEGFDKGITIDGKKRLPTLTPKEAETAYNNWIEAKSILVDENGDPDNEQITNAWGKMPSNVRTAIKKHAESVKVVQQTDEQAKQHINAIKE